VIVAREHDDFEGEEGEAAAALEDGLVAGVRSLGVPVVGVEQRTADPSDVPFFVDRGISTVDSIDRVSGQVATVYALCGASGDFGVKETADALLPDLVDEPCPTRVPGGAAPQRR
jgi:hypothetical protein